MARHMSNRERIERLAAEAQAAAREKKDKTSSKTSKKVAASDAPAEEKTTEPRTRSKSARAPKAMKIVWKVFNATGKEVAVFPYPKRAEADAHAATLAAKNGIHHFVEPAKVPME